MISVTAIGNLGRDGELRAAGNTDVVNFSIACRGREKDQTTWVDCALFGKRATAVAPYLKKGGRVACMGTLTVREHNGKTYLKLDVQELELLGDKPRDGDARGTGRQQNQRSDDFDYNQSSGGTDEIPF